MRYPSAHSVSVYICLTKERVKWKEVGAKGIQPQGTSVKLVCIGLICFNFFVGVCIGFPSGLFVLIFVMSDCQFCFATENFVREQVRNSC